MKSPWRVREDGGEGQAAGVPINMEREDANGIARAQSGARLAGMNQERMGEGLVIWDGQARPVDMIAVAVVAGGSIRVDGT